jgi:hypothetical protein
VTKQAKFSGLPTQSYQAEAYGVTDRTIRNWKHKDAGNANLYPRHLSLAREWRQAAAAYPKGKFGHLFRASITLHGIPRDPRDIVEPEKRQLYYDTKVSALIHPAAAEAVKPENALHLAAAKLRLAGRDVTRQTLADELGVHPRTLNRRYGKANVRRICPITRRRRPRIDSRKADDLVA